MDHKRIDEELRQRAEKEDIKVPFHVEEKIKQTFVQLSESPSRKGNHRFFPGAKYWLCGVASVLFAVILLSYFQGQSPFTDTPSQQPGGEEVSAVFSDEDDLPVELEDAVQSMVRTHILSNTQLSINKEDIEIITSIKQDGRWYVMSKYYNQEQFMVPYIPLIEVKFREDGSVEGRTLSINHTIRTINDYDHKYIENEGIGFGTVAGRDLEYIEKVRIKTEDETFISHPHNGGFIYKSNTEPEKIEFIADTGKVMRTMETFNFDEQYPLISKDEGSLSLLIVDENKQQFDWKEFNQKVFVENGIRQNVSTSKSVDSLESINEKYKFLNLEKSPAYVVFDHKEMIYKTYNLEDLIEFLKQREEK
ncbi:hypothetical protein [Salinibacillus xinjiangensis]|uniref:Uncharacterized protein n=1 Tax=Salinibacillus xinjiangensis TaxID=1229268 RepID=A0A6G1X9D5_9BACI|nr:hypothetical protein [Salinibacillus xinjiangensis]MRG87539.1 hypothetical protein [Salinibacillus xinjiangensis]